MRDNINYNIAHDRDLDVLIGVSVTERMNQALQEQVMLRNFRNRQDLIRQAIENYLVSIGVTGVA